MEENFESQRSMRTNTILGGPLSEHKGRRGPIIFTFVLFMVWTLACAVAPNWPAMLVFRFLAGTCASAPIAIVAGVLADIYSDTVQRGRAMAWFMAVSTNTTKKPSPIFYFFSF